MLMVVILQHLDLVQLILAELYGQKELMTLALILAGYCPDW